VCIDILAYLYLEDSVSTWMCTRSRCLEQLQILAMMIKQCLKLYSTELNMENAEQWKEAIAKEVTSTESHEVFTSIAKTEDGVGIIECCWVVGRMLMANGIIDKWKVRLVGHGELHRSGDYNAITSPVIDLASIWPCSQAQP